MKNLITSNPKILGGKPIIAGTRMSVEAVLELLAGGMEIKEILKEYPFVRKKHILACIDYATKLVGRTRKLDFEYDSALPRPVTHEIPRRR